MLHALVTTPPSSYLILYVPCRKRSSSPSLGVFSVAIPRRIRPADHEAHACGIVASGAGGVGVAKPVVCDVEEPLEHHPIQHAGEVPLRVSVRGRGGQLTSGAMVDSSLVAMRFLAARRW
jgi:hypothetical protein